MDFSGSGNNDDQVASPVPSAAPVPAPTATAYDATYVDTHLARLREAAGCGAAPHAELGVFCPAATGWATGTAAPFPVGEGTRIGLTTWVPTQGDVLGAFMAQRRFSVLASNSAGQMRGDIVSPTARNPLDTGPNTAMSSLLAHMRGTQPAPVPLPFGIYNFVIGRSSAPEYLLATSPNGWQLQGGSFADIRRVGQTWVAVEVPRQNPLGLYFTVFVDAEFRR